MFLLAICALILGIFFPPLWLLVPVFLVSSVFKDLKKIGQDSTSSAVVLGQYIHDRRERKKTQRQTRDENQQATCLFCNKPIYNDPCQCPHCKRTLRKN